MNDRYISGNMVLVAVLWTAVALLMGASLTLALLDPDDWIVPAVLAAIGVTTSAGAVVAHMRLYTSRLCALVRVTAGLQSPDSAEVTRLR